MRSSVFAGLVLVVVSGLPLTGCSLSGQKPGLITPAQATKVVRTWWAANEKASQSSDPKVWASLESGLQEQVDENATTARATLTSPTLQPRPINQVQVYVARQHSYPSFFTASLKTATHDVTGKVTGTPDIEMLDFSKPGPSDPWTVINGVSFGTNPLPRFEFDSDGYLVAPAQVPTPLMKPSQVSAAWAGYLNGVIQGKPDSGIFAPGEMTSTLAHNLGDVAAGGPLDTVTVQAYPEKDYQSQTLSDGSLSVFFAATYDVHHTPKSGYCEVQNADHQPWGALIAPGHYTVIDYKVAALGLAVVPSRDSKRHVNAYGFTDYYQVSAAVGSCYQSS